MTEQPPGPPPGNYPPPRGDYPPPPPQGGGYSPPGGGYAPPGGAYPPPGSGYPPPGSGYPPPQGGGYPPPPGSGYPPPPAGGYPPPPPGAGGYAPPPPGQAAGLPQSAYTPWITRVVAFIIDQLPLYILSGIGYGVWLASAQGTACVNDTSEYDLGQFCADGFVEPTGVGWAALLVTGLVSFAFAIWNYGYRQGTTGSSIGKSIMKFKVISEKTGQPIGFGLSIVRQIAHIVDTIICYIGYLFPLWDAKRQTLADKIMTTVCLPI